MLNIVLYQPEIFPNTGNIIRTCFALNAKLHIIKPIAFDLHPKYLKRAGAGKMLSDIQHEIHESYSDFVQKYRDKKIYYITRYGLKLYTEIDYKKDVLEKSEVWIMFGRESTGIDKQILKDHVDDCLRIPMVSTMRSLNLANCVCIISFEIMRQLNFDELSFYEEQKGKFFILKNENNK